MSDKLPVSVLIIAQNEETRIGRCLKSLTEFDEVVVVDGGSTDKTKEICEGHDNVRFYTNPWPGFIEQRNFSISKATHPWCFMIDADEACTEALVECIRDVLKRKDPKKMYRVMRTEFFEGAPIEKGFGRSNYQDRLFQRDHVKYTGGVHHNHLIDGELALPGHPEIEDFPPEVRVLHDEEYGIDEWLKKMPRFVSLLASERMKRGKRTNAFLVLVAFIGTFFQIYSKSWREGRRGFIISVMTACHRCLIKLLIYTHQEFSAAPMAHTEKEYLG